jgi:predicted RNA-binding protein associated with RNAse of E/G family
MSRAREVLIQYHRPGKSRLEYHERLILDQPEIKVLLLPAANAAVEIGGAPALEQGAPIIWFVFPTQCSDVGRFHLLNGTFTGWYTNLCTPLETNNGVWSLTDLFLDLWIPTHGSPVWLDQEEFDHATRTRALDEELVRLALAERSRIERLLSRHDWPPSICREWDLERIGHRC